MHFRKKYFKKQLKTNYGAGAPEHSYTGVTTRSSSLCFCLWNSFGTCKANKIMKVVTGRWEIDLKNEGPTKYQ